MRSLHQLLSPRFARLCALRGQHDEAHEWFVKARSSLEDQGARPLRAIADFDEALMYLRRGLPSDPGLAAPFLREASAAFDSMGMTGWSERARRIHQSGSEQGL